VLWAGLNLAAEDLPAVLWATGDERVAGRKQLPLYPLELVRAVTVVWLFAGLRSDEIRRLRLGCIRWQRSGDDTAPPGLPTTARGKEGVCWLDIPVHKTGRAFTKPVDGSSARRSARGRPFARSSLRPSTPRPARSCAISSPSVAGGSA
jgi:hypothetical protein